MPDELDEVIAEVLASDIGIVTLPITNLYLQGWEHPVSTPRGLTAVRALLDAGVRLGAGADNVRDPFNPVGRSDALETASLLVTAGHLTLDEAYAAVSDGARAVMGLPTGRRRRRRAGRAARGARRQSLRMSSPTRPPTGTSSTRDGSSPAAWSRTTQPSPARPPSRPHSFSKTR